MQDVKKADFPLPQFGPKLKEMQNEASFGRGFVLLKGVPVDRYTRRESLLAYWLIGQHWGMVRGYLSFPRITGIWPVVIM